MFRLVTRIPRGQLLSGRYAPHPQQSRTFFGLGEIAGVLANPAETIRQLNESKDLLNKAREESKLKTEAKRIPKKHTFSKLPGFHGREAELSMLRKILAGNPQLNVIFGATSVGKTALLREVLAGNDFFVIKFDLRISGFADLKSLYYALCEQFQSLFTEMHDEQMDKLSIAFKHMMLDMDEKPLEYDVSVADIADLMETLQSCLLRYLQYDPEAQAKEAEKSEEGESESSKNKKPPARKVTSEVSTGKSDSSNTKKDTSRGEDDETEEPKIFKKRPIVFLMDECHKLPALVNNQLSLKVFLDTLLVLTKQDRLCHVILSTSDPFFHHFLRSLNVGHHTHLLTIGDCSEEETLSFIREQILPQVPDNLRSKLNITEIYEAFGGKLSHISDYVSVWVNTSGETTPYQSAIFTQAYTLLQFHLTHESFDTYSPLSTSTAWSTDSEEKTQFTRADLLRVMRQLTKSPYSLPYFQLCREIGTEQADAMVRTRVLDLRWTKTVTPEQGWIERVWSQDGVERPVVLPMTRIVRRAMEVCLEEEDKREEGKE